jgi:uncharacterized membrane protein
LKPFFLEGLLICTAQVLHAIPGVLIGKRMVWNTRPAELIRSLTGDAFITGGFTVNRAITISRPAENIWPWITQFGRGAAYYSWDFLDNPGHTHADYLLDTPDVQVGDWNADIGTVRHAETGTELVWYDEPVFFGLRAPVAMTFRLDPEPDEATRVLFRISFGLPPEGLKARIALRVGVFMDHVMSTEMLRRLKLLIETYEERFKNGELNRSLAPHQRSRWGNASQGRA